MTRAFSHVMPKRQMRGWLIILYTQLAREARLNPNSVCLQYSDHFVDPLPVKVMSWFKRRRSRWYRLHLVLVGRRGKGGSGKA